MICLHVDPSPKPRKNLALLSLLILLQSIIIYACGPISKESSAWVRVDLQLQTETVQQLARSGTGTRGSELAVVVPATTRFSEKGPLPSEALDWKKVNTSNNTVSLLLPVGESLRLFVYRYTEDYSLIELEQGLFSQSLHLNSIDFGQSDVFSVADPGTTLLVNGQSSSMLTIQLAQQFSGKLAQNYVRGAQVWADRVDSTGEGNRQLDNDENVTSSEPNGDYYLAPNYVEFVLATEGGFKLDSSGAYVPAAPMLATIPEDGQTEVNITPLTTLVASAPELAATLAQSGDWRADLASPVGIPGDLMRIAKAAEAYWMLLAGGSNPIIQNTQQQFVALEILSQSLVLGGSSSVLEDLPELMGQAASETMNNPLVSRELSEESKLTISSELINLTTGLVELLPDNEIVVENSKLADFDQLNEKAFNAAQAILCEFPEGVSVQFDPIILSITLVPTSVNTVAVRGAVSDDKIEALNAYWAINPPEGLQADIDPILVNATINQDGYVETILPMVNWDHFGSVSLQLTECSPVNVISATCNWSAGSQQVSCSFMD